MRARPVGEVEQPALYRIVRELSTEARQPMPRLYVSPTSSPMPSRPDATPERRDLLTSGSPVLDERELRGVIGHELSHVYNRDILISSVAGALATMITYLGYMACSSVGGETTRGPGSSARCS